MNRPFFSILIPTTGRTNLVLPAVKSTLDQTFTDFEIIIADSGSGNELEYLKNTDARVEYFKTPKGGPFLPWDESCKRAKGEYLLWLDDDNYLLPDALEVFYNTIKKTNADIITASHVYYYDDKHPRRYLRNSVGVLPYTHKAYSFDPKEAINTLFTFEKRGTGQRIPRLHPSETIFHRRVADKARKHLGFVVFHDMPSAHPHPVLLAFAESCYYIDRCVVIVGRLGESMSQTWSTAGKNRVKNFKPQYTPFTGFTRLNARFENFLAVKHLLELDVSVNWNTFSELYFNELCYLDSDTKTIIRNWKNFYAVTSNVHKILEALPFVVSLYVARRLRLHYLWRLFDGLRKSGQMIKGSGGEFSFQISKQYGIRSIEDLAGKLREIIINEAEMDINGGLVLVSVPELSEMEEEYLTRL